MALALSHHEESVGRDIGDGLSFAIGPGELDKRRALFGAQAYVGANVAV